MDKLTNDFSFGLMIWQVILLFSIGLWIYCLIDISKSSFKNNDKLVWILIVLLVPFIGSVLYLFVGRKAKIKTVTNS